MEWAFLWLMVALKVPIAALLYIVWWAVRSSDDEAASGGDGGSGVEPPHRPHTHGPPPRRRGPHGAPATTAGVPRTRIGAHARDVSAGRH